MPSGVLVLFLRVASQRARAPCAFDGGPHLNADAKSALVRSGPLWSALVRSGPLTSILVHSGPFWSILVHSGPSWSILVHPGPSWFARVHSSSLACARVFFKQGAPAGSIKLCGLALSTHGGLLIPPRSLAPAGARHKNKNARRGRGDGARVVWRPPPPVVASGRRIIPVTMTGTGSTDTQTNSSVSWWRRRAQQTDATTTTATQRHNGHTNTGTKSNPKQFWPCDNNKQHLNQ